MQLSLRRHVVPGVAIALVATLSGCGSQGSEPTASSPTSASATSAQCTGDDGLKRVQTSGVLRVAATNNPPQSWQDGSAWKGFDADILREVAKRLGVEVETTFPNAAGQVASVESDRADTTTGLLVTPDREKVLSFTEPFRWIMVNMIVREDDDRIKSENDLKDKVIGVGVGNAGAKAADAMKAAGLIGEIVTAQTPNDSFQLLKSKRVDAIIYQYPYFEYSSAQGAEYHFKSAFNMDPKWFGAGSGMGSSLAVRKTSCGEALAQKIDELIADMREDGTLPEIFSTYNIKTKVWVEPSS